MPRTAGVDSAPPAPPGGVESPETWVSAHGDALLAFALRRVADRATAEDLVQETLLSAWKGRSGFDGRCSFRSWLTRILRARIADHYRGARRSEALADGDAADAEPAYASSAWRGRAARVAMVAARGEPGPAIEAEGRELWAVLKRCATDLPNPLGRALRLRAFAGRTTEEICRAEGISTKNLSVRLYRARMLLRECLDRRWFRGDAGADTR